MYCINNDISYYKNSKMSSFTQFRKDFRESIKDKKVDVQEKTIVLASDVKRWYKKGIVIPEFV